MVDHLDSKNLVPFKRRRNAYHLPGLQKEAEEQLIDEVDPELRPEEQGFVRHFLGYADVFLNHANAMSEEELSQEPAGEPSSQEPSSRQATNLFRMPPRKDEAA